VREQKPANDAADNVACGKGNVDVKRLEFRKARRFEKDDRVAEDGIAAEDLGGPNDAVLNRGSRS
jgi:hypothetical protein